MLWHQENRNSETTIAFLDYLAQQWPHLPNQPTTIKYLYQLERACFDFIDRINLDPEALISRLWPKFDLDPEYEKVMFSP